MVTSKGSLERTIILLSLLAVTAAFVGSSVFVYRTVKQRLETDGKANLETALVLGSSRAAAEARRSSRERDGILDGRVLDGSQRFSWLVVSVRKIDLASETGPRELARTLDFPFESGDEFLRLGADDPVSRVHHFTQESSDGSCHRVAVRMVTADSGRPDGRPGEGSGPGRRGPPGRGGPQFRRDDRFKVIATAPIDDEVRVLSNLARSLAIAGGLAILASLLMLRFAVRRGLRPLRSISTEIGRVNEQRLSEPLAVDAVPGELATMVESFEAVRERLDAAFSRERRFTADAAHELRTPLAGLRASLEVALRRERSTAEHRETAEGCLGVTKDMQDMVESLLQLARGAGESLESHDVQLRFLVEASLATFDEDLQARRVTSRFESSAEGLLRTNEPLLMRVIDNVVKNASQHGAAGGSIEILITEAPDAVSFQIANPVDRLPADIEERAFEPLWRGDLSRDQSMGNSGLGLALVRQCVDALGGSVAMTARDGRFSLVVTLPRSPAPHSPDGE